MYEEASGFRPGFHQRQLLPRAFRDVVLTLDNGCHSVERNLRYKNEDYEQRMELARASSILYGFLKSDKDCSVSLSLST